MHKTHSTMERGTGMHIAMRLATLAIAALASLSAPTAARADDTEVFFTQVGSTDKPNIVFIVDSSETMGYLVGTRINWTTTIDWVTLAKGQDPGFSCDQNRLYWTTGGLTFKTLADGSQTIDCSAMPYVDVNLANPNDLTTNKFVCDTAMDVLRASSTEGYVTQGPMAQYDKTANNEANYKWKRVLGINANGSVTLANTQHSWYMECLADDGLHGIDDISSAGKHPNDGTTNGFGNSTDSGMSSSYTKAKSEFKDSLTFFTAKRLAFEVVRRNTPAPPSSETRLQAVQEALEAMVNSVTGVRVGLMRFDNNAGASKGGMVVQELTDVESGRAEIVKTLFTREKCNKNDLTDCQKIFVPADKKSIGETLWEAYRYYSNGSVDFGMHTHLKPTIPFPSVDASMANPSDSQPRYQAPVSACSKNYIVLLTDGLTSQDNSRDVTGVAALPNFKMTPEIANYGTANAKCDVEDIKAGPTSSDCVDDLPAWMFRNDVNSAVAGVQTVKTYTVGFDLGTGQLDLAARSVLRDAARRGGGEYFDATDRASLTVTLNEIVRQILVDNASFTAPSVAVNAFNRTQNLNDIFMSVFKPSLSYRWLGNVKKYQLTPEGEIVDSSSPPKPAVDASTGFFANNTKSFWSDSVDGMDASVGGAAGELKDPATRKIYTNIADTSGSLAVVESSSQLQELSVLKDSATATLNLAKKILFNLDAASPIPVTYPSISNVIDWAYGYDVQDKVGTAGTTTDPRLDMGDPLHSRPATVIYGGTADAPDTVLFVATNDGYLHAINAADGSEYWAFAPVELLPRLTDLYEDDGAPVREYGLDGSVRAYKYDVDQDGVVESDSGDRVILYFGMRRGGSHLYALDVTDRSEPKLLWRAGAADDPARGLGGITTSSETYLPGIGETWSTPVVSRVNVSRSWPSDNPQKAVVVLGGGYDVSHDTKTTYSTDSKGNAIYMLDAITGDRIWHAGPTSDSSAQLRLARMNNAITSDIRIFDLTGDGYADRIYASDLGGRVWRFDIINGESPSDLVVGGVFASLGVADSGGTPSSSNRKFFFAPDPALIRYSGQTWINIAIGSGDRERPITDTTTDDRFYSLRDYNVFTPIPSDKYLSDCSLQTGPCHQIITANDSRLTDVTTNLSPTFSTGSAGWYMDLTDTAEKALAESRTFQNQVYFTTYSPRARDKGPECGNSLGVSKLYVVNAVTAKPVFDYDVATDGVTSISDRSKELAQGAIAPEVVFIFPSPDELPGGGAAPAVPPVCLVGLESCGGGVSNPPVRTYWRQRNAN